MRFPNVAAALLVSLALVCAAQTQFPKTPAGHQFAAWLESFNRGDVKAPREFVEKNFPPQPSRLERQMEFRQRTGGFDLKKIEESSATKLVVLVQERSSDQFARLTMEVKSEEPHKITTLELRAIPRPAEFALLRLPESALIAATRKNIEAEVADDRFARAVLVAKKGKPVLVEAYGLGDRERKTPNTVKTRFRVGSMNKMFTAVATLQLAQARKLDLSDTLGKYLPDYPNQDVASKVTIQQLLTHTGG